MDVEELIEKLKENDPSLYDVTGPPRYYEKKFPEVGSIVIARITRINNLGAYADLIEYGNCEGMILHSEISKRRIRSLAKLIKVDKLEICEVVRVDEEKKYIDLSKKKVVPEDSIACENRYAASKKIYNAILHLSQKSKMSVNTLNSKIVWPLYAMHDTTLRAIAAVKPSEISSICDIPLDVAEILHKIICAHHVPKIMRIRLRINVVCTGYAGITALKDALIQGLNCSTEKYLLSIKLLAPPQYVILLNAYNVEEGKKIMEAASKKINDIIKSYPGGNFSQDEFVVLGEDLPELVSEEYTDSDESDSEDNEEDETMGKADEVEDE